MVRGLRWRVARLPLGVVVSGVTLWLALRSVELAGFWAAVRSVQWGWLVGLALLAVAANGLRAWRWRWLLGRGSPRVVDLFHATAVGYLASYILPVRGGEVVRMLAARRHGTSRIGTLAGTLTLEKVLDVTFVLLLVLIGMTRTTLPDSLTQAARLLAVLVAVALLGTVALGWQRGRIEAFIVSISDRPYRRWPRGREHVGSFLEGFSAILAPKGVVLALGLSLGVWVVEVVGVWLGTRSLGVDIGLMGLLLVLGLVGLGLTLPSTPGGLGVYEFMVVTGLTVQGVGASRALAVAVVMHGMNFVMILMMGGLGVWRESLTLGQVRRMARAPQPELVE